jgi:hypothetical protein
MSDRCRTDQIANGRPNHASSPCWIRQITTLATIGMLAAMPVYADQPTKCYILNFGTGECELAAELAGKQHQPGLSSPVNLQAAERSMGYSKRRKSIVMTTAR